MGPLSYHGEASCVELCLSGHHSGCLLSRDLPQTQTSTALQTRQLQPQSQCFSDIQTASTVSCLVPSSSSSSPPELRIPLRKVMGTRVVRGTRTAGTHGLAMGGDVCLVDINVLLYYTR